MGTEKILQYLKESFEKELESLRRKKEEEEKAIRESFRQRALILKEELLLKEREILEEIKKDLENRYLQREIEAQLIFQTELRRLMNVLSRDILVRLKRDSYERVFYALLKEVPPIKWHYIRINPEDRERALNFFPEAIIIEDENIIGGFELISEDKRIFLDNTFEKRLERIKDEIEYEILLEVKRFIEEYYA